MNIVTKIIGLTGYAGSGKDSVANILADRGYTRVAFADPLKDFVEALRPSVRLANRILGREWAKRLLPYVRRAYQSIGQTARDIVDPDLWINALDVRLQPLIDKGKKIVVTDVRYLNEAILIQGLGGSLYRVDRPGCGPVNGHESETNIRAIRPDGVINNSGDLDQLKRVVAAQFPVTRSFTGEIL